MSRLEQLIAEFCPDGVETAKIQDVCVRTCSGGTPTASRPEYYDGDIPWLRTQEVDYKDIWDTEISITSEGFKNSSATWIPVNSVIVAMYGASAARVAVNKIPLTTNQACCNLEIDKNLADYRYVYYWLSSQYKSLKALSEGAQPNLNVGKVKNYPIPLPPLPIQEQIVRMLDTFTALEAELEKELEKELEARTKQYEYYRDALLNFDSQNFQVNILGSIADVEQKTIESLCYIQRGRVMSKDYLRDNAGKYPVYSSQTENEGVFGFINTFDFDIESLTWTTDGANAGSVFYHKNKQFSITNVCGLLRAKTNEINIRYLYYCLQKDMKNYVNDGMGNPKLMSNMVGRIKIPVPPIPVQEEIVAILDRFEALVSDLKSGLPAEIALRRKQYEYYRDQLLTFQPLE